MYAIAYISMITRKIPFGKRLSLKKFSRLELTYFAKLLRASLEVFTVLRKS